MKKLLITILLVMISGCGLDYNGYYGSGSLESDPFGLEKYRQERNMEEMRHDIDNLRRYQREQQIQQQLSEMYQ